MIEGKGALVVRGYQDESVAGRDPVIGDGLHEGLAIHAGHVEIEQHDERIATGADTAQGRSAVGSILHEVAFVAQESDDAKADITIVLDDEDAVSSTGKN